MSEKPTLTKLFRDNPATPEGKYLVKRRDGSIPEWPHFTLAAADPAAPAALRAYADAALHRGLIVTELYMRIMQLANEFEIWREGHWTGDPGKGKHRVDDPATIAEMRKGKAS